MLRSKLRQRTIDIDRHSNTSRAAINGFVSVADDITETSSASASATSSYRVDN
ncbi:hypothetical protein DPMN_046036 [Dreissena polymorpha]|uniref:Uncharacterized protein n=1 Tax=Dreissena polymorpha TaxID=45954 RepID=A0A9D4D7D6_DREPO|nr:hypothetical protein DPMN_046036 [Dreissena polymorpha]